MDYAPYPTATLLIPSGPADVMHLFVIVTNKCRDGLHLLYSISSIKPGIAYDDTCVFQGGEHEFIRHPSYVYYRLADQRRAASISRMVATSYFLVKQDFAMPHFRRLCAGVTTSRFTTPATLKYYAANAPALE